MKTADLPRTGIIFLLLFAGIVTAFDSTAVTNDIEETMPPVPYMTAVEGAESVKTTVNKDKERSNYSVSLERMETKSGIKPEMYEAFCVLWDTPIESDNSLYGDVKIHSIQKESYWERINYMVNQIIIIPGGEINGAFGFIFQNFANSTGPAIIQKAGGNTSSTSLTWNEDKHSPIEISISEKTSGSVQLHSKIDTDGSNHNVNQGTSLPSSCNYGDLDRARVLIAASDENLKITLNGEFDGQTEEFVVENGVTPGNQVEHVVADLDFSDGLDLYLELDIEGDNRSSDGTSRVELEFGCPE